MCTAVKIMLYSMHIGCTHICTKHKSVTQSRRTVVKIICIRTRICPKLFRDIASNCVDTKTYYVLCNFVDQIIHVKVKRKGRHRNLQKINVIFCIEQFAEMIAYSYK